VEKIVKDTLPSPSAVETSALPPKSHFCVLGGIAVPTGDFASTIGDKAGLAKTGFGFGAHYDSFLRNSIMWSLSLSAAFNPMDETAARQALGIPSSVSADISFWSTITTMVGFGFYVAWAPDLIFQVQGQIGVLSGTSPEMKYTSGSTTVTLSSASSTAFAFGFQAGTTIGGRVSLMAKFLSGQPKYKVESSGGGYFASGEFEQPTDMLQFFAGIAF